MDAAKYILFFLWILVLGCPVLRAQPVGLISDGIRDTIPADTSVNNKNIEKSQQFYDSLRLKANKNRITKEIYDMVIVPEKKGKEVRKKQKSSAEFERYAGKTIRKIDFITLDPFGTKLTDTGYYHETWITNLGNTLHVETRKNVLRRQLLIRPGTELDPQVLADNERIIRELPYIDDVRVIVEVVEGHESLADVIFITKDLMSTAFYVELKEVDAGKLELWDSNILGSGNEFQNNIHWDRGEDEFWGYEAFFKNRNIFGSFIDGRIFYQNIYEKKSYGFNFQREFFTPNTKYAGGFAGHNTSSLMNIWYYDTSYIREAFENHGLDFWIGRAFRVDSKNLMSIKRKNLILASRLFWEEFNNRPMVEESYLHQFHNKLMWLNYVAFSAQDFYRTNLLYSFGRTEDVPNGYLAKLTLGGEFGEFQNRTYSALELSAGGYILNLGYFYSSLSLGGFMTKEEKFQQGVLKIRTNYFTNLFTAGRYKFRHFANFNYTRGINRFPTERLNLNDGYGLTGLSRENINGKQKIVLNLQTVTFTPYYLYGFRFAFFGFTDLGFIGNQNIPLGGFKPFTAFGAGVRVRNERLVFPTFQFRIAVYPNMPNLDAGDYIHFLGEEKLNPHDFYTGPPSVIEYR